MVSEEEKNIERFVWLLSFNKSANSELNIYIYAGVKSYLVQNWISLIFLMVFLIHYWFFSWFVAD